MKVVETCSGITTARVPGSIRPIAWAARLRRVKSGAASPWLSVGPCGALGCDIWRFSADGDGRVPRHEGPGKPRAQAPFQSRAPWRRTTMIAATRVPEGAPLPRWLRLAAAILPVVATAVVGSVATQAEIPGWYASLN